MADDASVADLVRLRKPLDVVVEDKHSSTTFHCAITEIGSRGMRVISEYYLPRGAHYTFTTRRAPFLTARGEVCWVRTYVRDTFQCGVVFLALSEDARTRLRSFLDLARRRVPST